MARNVPPLSISYVNIPDPNAERGFHRALDLLADALAEQIIAQARHDLAQHLGRCPDSIDRERTKLNDETRSLLEAPLTLRGAA